MNSSNEHTSIWFIIGLQLAIYGVLISGAGVYGLFVPPARAVVHQELHFGLWWGLLLFVLGVIYVYRFFPRKQH